jgi:Tfp pilus assembly protein PilN
LGSRSGRHHEEDQQVITINLRPGAKRSANRGSPFAGLGEQLKGLTSGVKNPWQMVAMAAWVLVIGALGFLFWRTGSQMGDLNPRLEEARAEQATYQGFILQKRTEERVRDSILTQIGTISSIDGERLIWPHILDEVAYALPEATWITSITDLPQPVSVFEDSLAVVLPSFRIMGRTGDLANYTTFMRRLESSPWLENVLPLEAKTVIDDNRAITEFTIQATFSRADSSEVRTMPILESVVED